jgi:HEAT repeat protein
VRVLAVRALGYARAPAAFDSLIRLTYGGRTLFGRERLAPKSPELLAALAAMATGWLGHPRAQAVLERAAASSDPEIRAAVAQGRRA